METSWLCFSGCVSCFFLGQVETGRIYKTRTQVAGFQFEESFVKERLQETSPRFQMVDASVHI